jgi:outer membrane protein assembly factor BamA
MLAAAATIGRVSIHVGDIFDPSNPKENNRLYGIANRLHINTKDRVVANLLLFEEGDPYDPRLLAESERLLRQQGIFYDAEIRPVAYCDGRVDVHVEVRDVWTLLVSAGFNRAGGESGLDFELQDTNFLGYGKDVAIARRSDVDRTGTVGWYRDKSFLGSRARLELWYADNDDGNFQVFDLNQPFVSLDSKWSGGLRIRTDDRFDKLYTLGEARERFRREQDFAELQYGRSKGLVDGWTRRLLFGLTYVDDQFSKAEEGFPLRRVPRNRKLVYPWVGFDRQQDDFRTTHNLDQLSRTEDLFLGQRYRGRIGYAAESFGSDRNQVILNLQAEDGGELGKKGLVLGNVSLSGRFGEGEAENVRLDLGGRYYRRTFGNQLFVAQLSGTWAHNLDGDTQILLGGDNGLRGYPLRYQQGDRRFLFSLEQRFFTDWHVLNLAHVGAAIFADVGRAWSSTERNLNPGVDEMLYDIGVGLRVGSSRSGKGALVHIDVAFPLAGDGSIDDIQWLVTTKETF